MLSCCRKTESDSMPPLTMSLSTLQPTKSFQNQVLRHFALTVFIKKVDVDFLSPGKKTTMMSARNFYNAMTPGSSLTADMMVGKSAYKQIQAEEINSKFLKSANKLPLREETLLNQINEQGLLTYTDYHFLLLLMSTPTRYLDIIFHGFDVSADGSVEAKVTDVNFKKG